MPRIEFEPKLDFKDVLLRPKRSTLKSRADVDLVREYTFKNSKKTYSGVPVVASNMDTVGTFEMAETLAKHQLFTTIHKHYSLDEWQAFFEKNKNTDVFKNIAVSSGLSDKDFEKLRSICEMVPLLESICLDVANGYSETFIEYIRKVREHFPRHTIMAGNVVTGEMVEELILSGADIIKVGIGPGSVCTTRKKAGVGYPQLSAVLECADAAHGLGGHVMSDGGCTNPGDVAKAFGAGADFVMIGGLLAGHDQSGGEIIEQNGRLLIYGFKSLFVITRHQEPFQQCLLTSTFFFRGDVNNTVLDILGGIRSACTYTGSAKLKELSKRTTFIRVTQQTNDMYVPLEINPQK
ncbi:unnamed protein product [Haemonchus placei]|uniref:GMP reductase n=1 Tax=Haemonchus placei TaxID=6290 RepID=A0A0N4WNT1_HAEPC|nr:unnamed protein product [Haemonchus placei]